MHQQYASVIESARKPVAMIRKWGVRLGIGLLALPFALYAWSDFQAYKERHSGELRTEHFSTRPLGEPAGADRKEAAKPARQESELPGIVKQELSWENRRSIPGDVGREMPREQIAMLSFGGCLTIPGDPLSRKPIERVVLVSHAFPPETCYRISPGFRYLFEPIDERTDADVAAYFKDGTRGIVGAGGSSPTEFGMKKETVFFLRALGGNNASARVRIVAERLE